MGTQVTGSGVIRDPNGNQTGTYLTEHDPDGTPVLLYSPSTGPGKTFRWDGTKYVRKSIVDGILLEVASFVCLMYNMDGCYFWGWTSWDGGDIGPPPTNPTSGGTATKT